MKDPFPVFAAWAFRLPKEIRYPIAVLACIWYWFWITVAGILGVLGLGFALIAGGKQAADVYKDILD